MYKTVYLMVFIPLLTVFIYNFNFSLIDICELHTCPYCYGDNFCEELKNNVSLNFSKINYCIFNLISIKNVYFGNHNSNDIVLKKLAQTYRLQTITNENQNITVNHLKQILEKDELNQLHFCDSEVINIFLHEFKDKSLANLWTILKVNPEPLMLELFKQEDNWPTPKLYGFCGRCMVVKNDGVSLNEIINIDWYYRAFIALQLLDAAEKFTFAHSLFRLYLTDISLDNVVVDKNTFLISFIDLEHVVLKRKMFMWRSVHHTEHLHTEDYAFSVSEICSEDISDHNIYSICRLILSKDAPYPMKMNGLLHSPPSSLRTIEYGN
ncbi:divergent protein kinase domain 2A-like isoform X2 [Rhynchophorus ferrugineus]|uniref:divergent protein kinase domain 2A-like isoform X2 n=1 Tax=Rhynchophorus ferrugineus TaxID=354439 RepID=UPI003FCD5267